MRARPGSEQRKLRASIPREQAPNPLLSERRDRGNRAAAGLLFGLLLVAALGDADDEKQQQNRHRKCGNEVSDVIAHVVTRLIGKRFGLGLGRKKQGKQTEGREAREGEGSNAHWFESFHVRRCMQA